MSEFSASLHGGELFDPASGRRGRFDVAFDRDRVALIAPSVDRTRSARPVDAGGCLVVPGLIDLHSHVFAGIGEGVDADEYCLRRGTTTTVDGGSAGANTIAAFRRLALGNRCRTLAWLNLSTL